MTEIMPVPRNLILLSYQQGAFDLHLLQPFSRYDKMVKINGDNETV